MSELGNIASGVSALAALLATFFSYRVWAADRRTRQEERDQAVEVFTAGLDFDHWTLTIHFAPPNHHDAFVATVEVLDPADCEVIATRPRSNGAFGCAAEMELWRGATSSGRGLNVSFDDFLRAGFRLKTGPALKAAQVRITIRSKAGGARHWRKELTVAPAH